MRFDLFFRCKMILMFVFLLSCSIEEVHDYDYLLSKSGENKKELDKVFKKYRNKKDSLLLKSAYFLLENMDDKKCYSGKDYDLFLQFIDSLWSTDISREDYSLSVQRYKNINSTLVGRLSEKYDLKNIKSNLLIENINIAFQAWKNTSWNDFFTFDEFCEYILPYRIGDEPLVGYRRNYYAYYQCLLNKQSDNWTIYEAANFLLEQAFPFSMELIDYPDYCPDFDPVLLKKIKAGRCMDYVSHAVTVMRSVGIPSAIDFTPQWPNRSGSHSWGIILSEDKKVIDFEGAGVRELGNHITSSTIVAKIYRKTYAKQKESLALLSEEPIPAFFRSPYFYDVSHQYFTGIDIHMKIPENIDNHYAYLCVFDNKEWFPIAWSSIKNQEVCFSDMGNRAVYLPAFYKNDSIIAADVPVRIDSLGNVNQIIPDEINRQTITLHRKYPVLGWWQSRNDAMTGGKFQAADNLEFMDAVDMYIIPETPEMCYHTVKIKENKGYKYWRYYPVTSCPSIIAELSFFDKSNTNCVGEIIGTDVSINHSKYSKEKAFDGDPLTFFGGESDSIHGYWVGMAFDEPVEIRQIRFLCRNDDNFIKEKELYELFYWKEGQWVSLGKQEGGEQQLLVYENVPSGALFWLRNLTKGREERIFTYENGKQVWW